MVLGEHPPLRQRDHQVEHTAFTRVLSEGYRSSPAWDFPASVSTDNLIHVVALMNRERQDINVGLENELIALKACGL